MKDQSLKGITGFVEIFQTKLDKMKGHLKKELGKTKQDRDRASIKRLLADTQQLKRSVKAMRSNAAVHCPHCGEKI